MRILQLAALILAAITTAVAAQSPGAERSTPAELVIPATSTRVSEALLTSIMTWLSINFDLAPTALLPEVKHLSAAAMTRRRYSAFLGAEPAVSPTDAGATLVAIYDRTQTTIYLPLDWTGSSPAELSVLVHEMVHHLQHVAQTKFECPQAREQLAYMAQQRWLGLFDRTLETEFQIDPFTLLVATRCMH